MSPVRRRSDSGSPMPMRHTATESPKRRGRAAAGAALLSKTASLRELLVAPEALELRLLEELYEIMQPVHGQTEMMLRYQDTAALSAKFAQELEVDPSIFGEMRQLFWRFDFNGEGLLNERQSLQLCLCMLRKYRDATRTPVAGCVRLGGQISYKNIMTHYVFQKKIGEGGQGAVFLCKDQRRSQDVVVKMYDKSSPNSPVEEITREFELLMSVKHPRIARVFEIFQDRANIYVVQEPYFGGDLTSAVRNAAAAGVQMSERWLAQVFHQILSGVAYLHSNYIMHCDLKEPNIMITGKADWHAPQIVVIDFGLAHEFTTRSYPGGTPGYMPPEVWDHGLWTPKGDVFSLGVMLFSMRTGQQPFTEGCTSLEQVQQCTREKTPQMRVGLPALQCLVASMLDKDFRSRPVVARLLEDPWFSSANDAEQAIDQKVLSVLMRRQEKTDLKKALLADVASRENLAQLKDLNELFVQLDVDNDGIVSADDLRNRLGDLWPSDRVEALIQALVDGDEGEVSYEEFMGQVIATTEPVENELLWRLFCEADRQGKGFLDVEDIRALLQRPAIAKVLGGRDPATVLAEIDTRGRGQVSFEEFRLGVQGRAAGPTGVQQRRPLLGPRMRRLSQGQRAQYYSCTHSDWIPCTIIEVDQASGAVQVDCKPGYWLFGLELQTKLKPPRTFVEYFADFLNPSNWVSGSCKLCMDSNFRRSDVQEPPPPPPPQASDGHASRATIRRLDQQ